MIHSQAVSRFLVFNTVVLVCALGLASAAWAHETGQSHVHFQKPKDAAQNERIQFRSSSRATEQRTNQKVRSDHDDNGVRTTFKQTVRDNSPRGKSQSKQASSRPVKSSDKNVAATSKTRRRRKQARTNSESSQEHSSPKQIVDAEYRDHEVRRDERVSPVAHGQVVYDSQFQQACTSCGNFGGCGCEPACGIVDAGCGCPEPACGVAGPCDCADPGCGIPNCGFSEPGCGVCDCGEPSCGICQPTCGSCVGRPGPDYWCFPVCLPRCKELTFWGGVHGFRGPRDFSAPPMGGATRSDSNFGFQQGFSIGGRAPLIGLLFPQLSYQLGYQAVQSRLSGTATSDDDRSQQFVTGGVFRRVPSGLQFGVVWDLMDDDLDINADFQQIRAEFSLKSPRGREIGFWTAQQVSDKVIGSVTYRSVNQYLLFYRWHFRNGGEGRFWGGGTDDKEGLFGGEFQVPLNDRWSLQSGFNYLITDEAKGPAGVSEESWNVGMNLVWHFGCTARKARSNPFRPLFNVANNGLMFIDAKP